MTIDLELLTKTIADRLQEKFKSRTLKNQDAATAGIHEISYTDVQLTTGDGQGELVADTYTEAVCLGLIADISGEVNKGSWVSFLKLPDDLPHPGYTLRSRKYRDTAIPIRATYLVADDTGDEVILIEIAPTYSNPKA